MEKVKYIRINTEKKWKNLENDAFAFQPKINQKSKMIAKNMENIEKRWEKVIENKKQKIQIMIDEKQKKSP